MVTQFPSFFPCCCFHSQLPRSESGKEGVRKAYQIFNLLGPEGTRLTSVCVLVHSCGGNGGFREPGTLQRVPLPWLLPLESGKQEGKEALAGGRSDPHKESRGPSPLQGGGGRGYVVVLCSQEGEGHLCRGSTHGVSAMRGRRVYEGVESTLGVGRREGWRGESGNYSLNRGLKRVRNGSQERSQRSALNSDRSWWMQTRLLEMHFRTGLFLVVRQCRATCMGQWGGQVDKRPGAQCSFSFHPPAVGQARLEALCNYSLI